MWASTLDMKTPKPILNANDPHNTGKLKHYLYLVFCEDTTMQKGEGISCMLAGIT